MTGPTPKQARFIWLAVTGLAIATLIGLAVGAIWGLGQVLQILAPVLWPLAVAGVIAYLLDPVVDYFEKKGLSRAKSIGCVFAIAVLIVGIIFASIIPQIVVETRQLVSRLPEIKERVENRIGILMTNPPPIIKSIFRHDTPASATEPGATNTVTTMSTTNIDGEITMTVTNAPPSVAGGAGIDAETLESIFGMLGKAVPSAGRWLTGQVGRIVAWFGILAGLALVPVYAFYLLLEKRGIESRWTDYLPVADSRFKDEIVFVLKSINDYLIAFFRGQVLVAICDSVLYTIGFSIVGLPYAVLLGFCAIFLTLIPFLGAIALCATALIIAAVHFGDWMHPAGILAVFAVVQTLEGLVISPKIMGDRVGLHPLTIIIAVMAGTTLLGGLLGGILAIPLTAVLRVLMGRYVWTRRAKAAAR